MDEATYLGPVTRRAQLDVLKRQVAEARKLGGKVLTGGKPIAGRGNWFEPTVVVNVDHRMRLMRDESFGPVIGIQRVRDDDEAIALMNDSDVRPDGGRLHVRARSARNASSRTSKPAASTGTAATASARDCRGRASRSRGSG